jgi:hypothetical protein
VIVISVPIFTASRVKPRRNNVFGVAPSIIHGVVVPSAFLTSMCSHECGLIHSIFTIVPFSVTGRLASNSAANEWCAATGCAPTQRSRAPANEDNARDVIGVSPWP